MPGPGQGKRSQKKKWHENASNTNANIAAVNAVMTASSTAALTAKMATSATLPLSDVTTTAGITDETAQDISSHTATQPTTATATANTAAVDTNDASNAMHVDTATSASSTNNVDSQQYPFSYNEVQELLDEVRLEGWREGMEEGYKMGKKKGVEEIEEKCKEEWRKGMVQGTQLGEYEERRKWLEEGHGPGMCVSTQRHTHEIETSNVNGQLKEDTWKHGYGHCVSVEEGSLMLVTEVAKAIASK
jgi:hypothetical protein